jgi:transcriptional regulator with XRE-family HTH domain
VNWCQLVEHAISDLATIIAEEAEVVKYYLSFSTLIERPTMDDTFSDRLKAARDLRKVSQGDLAARAGLPPTSISHFEAGSRKPSFENLRRLAIALEVTTDFLLGLSAEPEMSISANPLFRHGQNLSSQDRDLADEFLKILANRNKPKPEGGQ